MISQIKDGNMVLEIPIVFGMVMDTSGEDWLGKEIKEITKTYREALERAGFLYEY